MALCQPLEREQSGLEREGRLVIGMIARRAR